MGFKENLKFRQMPAVKAVKGIKKAKGKKPSHKFVIDCELPISDNYFVLKDFEQYMAGKIKVDGKMGNLGNAVTVTKDTYSLVVTANIAFSKRYLKYLTKQYPKKQELREYLRIVASNKNTYQLRYLNILNDEE